jgi:hypothetical protein
MVGVGVDRQTGEVYEASNGPQGHQIDPSHIHPTLRAQEAVVRQGAGTYTNRMGSGQAMPGTDALYRHAEVKVVNEILWSRTANGGADDLGALSDITVCTQAPYQSGGDVTYPFCANCAHLLPGVGSVYGRYMMEVPTGPGTWDNDWYQ